MFKSIFTGIIFCVLLPIKGLSQSSAAPIISSVSYHPPTEDKSSWQRLLLLLSSTYLHVVKEGQVDLDNSLFYASRSLGLSRLPVLAEGIDDTELLAQSQWIDQKDPTKGIRLLSQTTGKKHLEVLVLLGAYYAFQPYSYYRYRDSVEYFLVKAINESKTINETGLGRQAVCLLGKMYVQANDLVKGDSVFNALVKECQIANDRETEARAFAYRGLYTAYSPATTQDRITCLQKAGDIYRKLNNKEGEINVLTNTGYLHVTTFQLQNANDVFLKAFQLEESIGYPYTQYNTDALAMVTGFENKFGEPLRYTLETIKTAESNRDSIGWGYFYSRLGTLYYIEGGRSEESLKWYQKGLDRFMRGENEPALYLNLNNMVGVMNFQGHDSQALDLVLSVSKKQPPKNSRDSLFYHIALSGCYGALKQYRLAETHTIQASLMQKRSEALIGPLRRADVTYLFALNYFREGRYAESKQYFAKYLSDPSRMLSSLQFEISVYYILIKIDSAVHDAVSGLKHYQKYTQLLENNFTVSKLRQAEELNVMYLTEEKENQIILLNQKSKLEQANTKQAKLVKNVTIAGIIAVLIITILLYRQSRLRKKNNNVITHKNELLQHYLTEKEWLLKEIHHRVKNNLQIVMSLLNSQSAYIENDAALTAIHDSQHRVHAMSLIHQKLYNSEDVSSIDMSFYIRELVSYLRDSFNTGQRIRFEFSLEPLELDVSQAVPLGLILNEAITNSIKYAFPNEGDGLISISLSNKAPRHYLLVISDNGIGMPANVSNKKPGSLGLSLMAGLSEDLDGKFTVENNNGTIIKISFAHDLTAKRPGILTSSFVTNN